MTADPEIPAPEPREDAEVIPLRPDAPPAPAPPDPPKVKQQPGERRPVIPKGLRRENVRSTAGQWGGLQAHRAAYHGVRIPWYVIRVGVFAVKGTGRLIRKLLVWMCWTDGLLLEYAAIAHGGREGHADAMGAHRQGLKTRGARARIVAGMAIAALVALALVMAYAPWWLLAAAAGAGVLVLAHYGRPQGVPIAHGAVVPKRFEDLTDGVVSYALASIGIPALTRAAESDRGIEFTAPIHRDGPGWLALINLPHGVTAGEVMEKRDKLASSLRRPIGCVWPAGIPGDHPGALALWVGYEDMAKAAQPEWSLARRGTADLFRPQPVGLDQRGKVVAVTLMFISGIIGAVPRMGKTFLLRVLLLIAALDVRAEIHAYDNKGTGDLAPLRHVAYRYGVGDEPDDIEYGLRDMRALRDEMRRRTRVIRGLPMEVCPENKVTPELAANRKLRLHPIVVGVDECQVWFEHPEHGKEFEEICTDLVKRGPAVGIILILATQQPNAKSIPTPISNNAVLRFCLKVMGHIANDQVLGQSMHANGIKATMFSLDDKGIFYLAGEGEAPRIVRGFNINAPAAEVIALRARGLREKAGTLAGYCTGSDDTAPPRDFLADVLEVFGANVNLYRETIAARLAEAFPDVYPAITADAVASQLRDAKVTVEKVREPAGQPLAGCKRASVEAAIERRRETCDA